MTVEQMIRQMDEIKPNAFTMGQKARWLGDMEGQIWTEILRQSGGDWDSGMQGGRRLLLPGKERRMYEAWLSAMIDLANGEYTKYAAGMSLYNSFVQAFAADYAQRFRPADRVAFWTKVGTWSPGAVKAGQMLPAGYAVLGALCRVTEAFGEGTQLSLGFREDREALLREADILPETAGVRRALRLFWPSSGTRQLHIFGETERSMGKAEFYVLLQPGEAL